METGTARDTEREIAEEVARPRAKWTVEGADATAARWWAR